MGHNTTALPSIFGEGGESAPSDIFSAYHAHASAQRISSDTIIQSALRAAYPTHHLAVTTCNLLTYAKAGHAAATPHAGGNAKTNGALAPLLRTRTYDPPARRTSGELGKLADNVAFGLYDYVWRDDAFLVYAAEGQNGPFCQPDTRFYVLKQRGSDDEDVKTGDCGATDALLLAANAWAEHGSHNEVWVFDQGRWRKDRDLWEAIQDVDVASIVLEGQMKEGIMRDVVGFFGAREQYARFGTPWKRGLIFHGTPGNGKTMTVKALVKTLMQREDPIPTLYVKTLAQRSFGPQQSVRQIFTKARRSAPCLLLFEDVDSLVKEEVRSYFLNEIDGLENNDGILMIGSTNNLDNLDPGLSKRPSRFDRKYNFKRPSLEARIRYCDWWRNKFADNPDLKVEPAVSKRVAELTDGFSFAYLKEAWVASLLSLLYSSVSTGAQEASGKLPETLEKQIEILKAEMGDAEEKEQDAKRKPKKTKAEGEEGHDGAGPVAATSDNK
ncbi:P-loop containing nucleoside triphosphate hydrolase protein [Macrophomina phaseolina]|uniref:P-loop containing nucleoside triphosphate hydrolase protein n=1 Tax=Macrophomina phaseolina TaxID=35725 RepID=A0ABQ8GJF5_9PEZI|nr:P-loop containing nucleoside triphosphate hydrolase protein [Macrophomina phaseolina]